MEQFRSYLKQILNNWLNTYSNEKSEWSSKKIERSILVTSAISMYWIFFFFYFVYLPICRDFKISVIEFVGFVAPLFGYAGFTLKETEKEKRENKPIE